MRFLEPVLIPFGLLLVFFGGAFVEPKTRVSQDEAPSSPWTVRLVDVAAEAGLDQVTVFGPEESKRWIIETTGCGIAFFDFDGDGWLDVYQVNGTTLEGFPPGREPTNHLYRNNRNGTFTEFTEEAGLRRSGWGQGVCAGDYDGDGKEDLFVTYWGENVLYRNLGGGSFQDVTAAAGLVQGGTRPRWNTGCSLVDYDRDGDLDLFVANYVDLDLEKTPAAGTGRYCQWKGIPVMCGPRGLPGGTNLLYRNNGDGTFTDVSEEAGISRPSGYYCFTPLTGDFNQDGWPDIYVACDSTPNLLYENNRDGTFSDVAVFAGSAFNEDGQEQAGMGTDAGDYNQDGFLDILVTNFSDDTSTLYRNHGDGTFTDSTFEAGLGVNTRYLGWGCAFLDLDNDSWVDIFLVNGHVYPELEKAGLDPFRQVKVVYRNLGNGRFQDLSRQTGPGVQLARSSRGAAFGDFDNDGDVDIVVNNIHDPPSLLRNDGGNRQGWLQVRTVGTRSNRTGIGARVEVRVGGKVLVQEVRSGGSYISQNDFRLHFGLGSSRTVEEVVVHWPSGQVDTIQGVAGNQLLTIREGEGAASR